MLEQSNLHCFYGVLKCHDFLTFEETGYVFVFYTLFSKTAELFSWFKNQSAQDP